MYRNLQRYFWLACMLLVAACGRVEDFAHRAHVSVFEQGPGPTPFIRHLTLNLGYYAELKSVSYTIKPKPGSFSAPVSVTIDKAWLDRYSAYNGVFKRLTFSVFGLYADCLNDVAVTALFSDGSTHVEQVPMQTLAYSPDSPYLTPDIKQARTAAVNPDFDFMFIQNGHTSPVVIDTDGNLRWATTGFTNSAASNFGSDAFYLGSATEPALFTIQFDGSYTRVPVLSNSFIHFHHDLARGKSGFLGEFDASVNGVSKIESVLAEFDADGKVLKEWDLAEIFRKQMRADGDDPSNFVRDGFDWFHMNSAIYSEADDSLIVSSRESFVVKLDYETGKIKWLFGDPTKHWYVDYPSLRKLALTLTKGKVPIGQHALSIASDGNLMLFNNGFPSSQQPPGTPIGEERAFSTPSRYAIDEKARTAAEVWTYEHLPPVYSRICSSVLEAKPNKYLVAYSAAEVGTKTKVLAVDEAGKVAFEIDYPTTNCRTTFIARPFDFGHIMLK